MTQYSDKNLVIIGSGNGLSPVSCQANAWTKHIMSTGPLTTYFCEIVLKITFFCYENSLKTSAKWHFNTLRPRHNGRHFADDIFKCIFFNENVRISIKISQKFVPKGPISNIPALFQIMAWRRTGDKPLSETMMVRLMTHICVTRPHWVKPLRPNGVDMHQWNESSLVPVMTSCWLLSTKQLPYQCWFIVQ